MTSTPRSGRLDRRTVLLGAAAATASAAIAAGAAGCGSTAPGTKLPPPGTDLGAAADIGPGPAVLVTVAGAPVILAAGRDGTVVAHTAICTHQHCTVAIRGVEATCPCHGSMFDPATGEVLRGPAKQPLAAIAVDVVAGRVVVTPDAGTMSG